MDYGYRLLIAGMQPRATLQVTSVIVGAAIGAVFFKERFGAPRIAAAGLLVVGTGLLLHAGQRAGGSVSRVGPRPGASPRPAPARRR